MVVFSKWFSRRLSRAEKGGIRHVECHTQSRVLRPAACAVVGAGVRAGTERRLTGQDSVGLTDPLGIPCRVLVRLPVLATILHTVIISTIGRHDCDEAMVDASAIGLEMVGVCDRSRRRREKARCSRVML